MLGVMQCYSGQIVYCSPPTQMNACEWMNTLMGDWKWEGSWILGSPAEDWEQEESDPNFSNPRALILIQSLAHC
jgi:hypothetical protein